MKQDIAKQAARDEKLVPTDDKVKISKSNLRIDPSMNQLEETFQVALDILKNVPFYNAFLISADVPEIYMQQFWFTIKKVKMTSYYKFEIDHKTCQIDVETFRKILYLTPNVKNQDFIQPPSFDDLKEFLLELGYMGKLPSISEIHVDHMHQPWRTFGAIIKIFLSDLQYQIDYRQTKVRRREIMPYLRFNKVIIHYFMSQNKSISKREGSPYYTVDDDDALISDDIKKSKAYEMFFKYSTGLIPPKKSRGRAVKENLPKEPTKSKQKPSKVTQATKELVAPKKLKIDTLKAQKASRRESRLQHQTGGSSEGTGSKPGGSTYEEMIMMMMRVETNDDRDEEEEDDDRSTNIEETDAERTESDDEHQGKGDADMNIEQEVKKEMSDEKPKDDEQVTEAQPNDDNKDNFTEPAEGDITSMMDVHIHQDVPNANNVELKKELSELNYKEVIDEFVKAHVVKEVKNFLPYESSCSKRSKELSTTGFPKGTIEAAKSLSELELKNILYEKMLKSGSSCSHKTHKELLNALTWSIKLDESRSKQKTKNRRTRKETKSSKKSSTPKESSRGKPPSKPSKSGKSRSTNDVEETVFEMGSDDVDQTFDKKADDSKEMRPCKMGSDDVDQTFDKKADDSEQFDANTEQPSLAIAANPKRQKHDWYKKSPTVPPLTFDELMSTPIDFSTFAMNCLGLKMLTREVLMGPVFNLLKGKPLPLIEKEGRLAILVKIFFNNDLEYLKGDKAKRTYCSSITKMTAAKYTMEEGDFLELNLSDIEYMLLLIAQQNINNLDGDVIVDFVTALKMFSRSIIVQNRVENVQLGVESYQRKLNLLKPQRTYSDITSKELAWTTKDQDRIVTILKKIDDILLKRRIMRSLEVLMGGRTTKTDKRILQRTA
ncbi:hypothetical protein Tco_0738239 [Tanacetum coccineum]